MKAINMLCICPVIRISSKIKRVLPCLMLHPSTKFHEHRAMKLYTFPPSFMVYRKCFLNYFSASESARLHSQQVSAFFEGSGCMLPKTEKISFEQASFKTWDIEVYSQQWWTFNTFINSVFDCCTGVTTPCSSRPSVGFDRHYIPFYMLMQSKCVIKLIINI